MTTRADNELAWEQFRAAAVWGEAEGFSRPFRLCPLLHRNQPRVSELSFITAPFFGHSSVTRPPLALPPSSHGTEQRYAAAPQFPKQTPLDQRLGERAKRLRKEAQGTPPGVERDNLIRLAMQAETAAEMDEWLFSPPLTPR